MSLERKDVRLYLDAEVHEALAVLADLGRQEIKELAEQIITAEVIRRVHAATVVAEKTARLGIVRSAPEPAGKSRYDPER